MYKFVCILYEFVDIYTNICIYLGREILRVRKTDRVVCRDLERQFLTTLSSHLSS